jgi:hypothetical protein
MRFLLYVVPIAVILYALFDVASTPQNQVRNLPKWGWILIILLLELLGALAWFIAGRPKSGSGPRLGRGRIIPPDDDPEFLKNL